VSAGGSGSAIVVERSGSSLVVRSANADGAGVGFAAALPPEPTRTTVVVDASAIGALNALDARLIGQLEDRLPPQAPASRRDMRLVAARTGSQGPSGGPPLAARLADRLGVGVVAPDGEMIALRGGELFSAGVNAGWLGFAPGRRPEWNGPRYPAPPWQDALQSARPSPRPRVRHRTSSATPTPAGLWLRVDGAAPLPLVDLGFGVPVEPARPVILVGAPGEPLPDLAELADLIDTMPATLRETIVVAPYGQEPGACAALAQDLADLLGTTVRAYHALPYYAVDGTCRFAAFDDTGRPDRLSTTPEHVYLPGGPAARRPPGSFARESSHEPPAPYLGSPAHPIASPEPPLPGEPSRPARETSARTIVPPSVPSVNASSGTGTRKPGPRETAPTETYVPSTPSREASAAPGSSAEVSPGPLAPGEVTGADAGRRAGVVTTAAVTVDLSGLLRPDLRATRRPASAAPSTQPPAERPVTSSRTVAAETALEAESLPVESPAPDRTGLVGAEPAAEAPMSDASQAPSLDATAPGEPAPSPSVILAGPVTTASNSATAANPDATVPNLETAPNPGVTVSSSGTPAPPEPVAAPSTVASTVPPRSGPDVGMVTVRSRFPGMAAPPPPRPRASSPASAVPPSPGHRPPSPGSAAPSGAPPVAADGRVAAPASSGTAPTSMSAAVPDLGPDVGPETGPGSPPVPASVDAPAPVSGDPPMPAFADTPTLVSGDVATPGAEPVPGFASERALDAVPESASAPVTGLAPGGVPAGPVSEAASGVIEDGDSAGAPPAMGPILGPEAVAGTEVGSGPHPGSRPGSDPGSRPGPSTGPRSGEPLGPPPDLYSEARSDASERAAVLGQGGVAPQLVEPADHYVAVAPEVQEEEEGEFNLWLADRGSTSEERQAFRRSLGWRHDAAARGVARLLAERPGLRGTGPVDEALLTDLAAVRVFAAGDQADFIEAVRAGGREGERAYAVCVASGLRRLPALQGVTVRGGPVDPGALDAYRPGEELAEEAPLVAIDAIDARVPGGAEVLIWSSTARRLDGLTDEPEAPEVAFLPGTVFRVLAVDPPPSAPIAAALPSAARNAPRVRRVLLAEVPSGRPTRPGWEERVRSRLEEAAEARAALPGGSNEDPGRFAALPGDPARASGARRSAR
jgi:hypothetical protein